MTPAPDSLLAFLSSAEDPSLAEDPTIGTVNTFTFVVKGPLILDGSLVQKLAVKTAFFSIDRHGRPCCRRC